MSPPHVLPPPARVRQAAVLSRREVVVLAGGRSSEREVSQKSAAAIEEALRATSRGSGMPASVSRVEIGTDGRWSGAGFLAHPDAWLARAPRESVFFLGLHGGEGENGTIQGLLSACGFAHTGSGVAASALCMDKHWTRLVLRDAGLSVAAGRKLGPDEWRNSRGGLLSELASFGSEGWSVKPNRGGSSVATFLLGPGTDPCEAIERVLATGDEALVEARIVGTEATCGVLGNARDELRALTPVEIVPHDGRFFDYEQKYSSAGADEFCPPRSMSEETVERLRELAVRAHRSAGCDGYSRTDFIVPRDARGAAGEPVVLEINTLPGMTDRSLLPKAAVVSGLDLGALCLEILALAIEARSESA